jgi:hypothetical protein
MTWSMGSLVSITWVAARRIGGLERLEIGQYPRQLLGTLAERIVGAERETLEHDVTRCTQQHDLVEVWVEQDLSIVGSDDEQHVSVLGRKEFAHEQGGPLGDPTNTPRGLVRRRRGCRLLVQERRSSAAASASIASDPGR